RLAAGLANLVDDGVGRRRRAAVAVDVGAEVVDHHCGTARGERECVLPAEPAARACHDRHLAIESNRHALPRSSSDSRQRRAAPRALPPASLPTADLPRAALPLRARALPLAAALIARSASFSATISPVIASLRSVALSRLARSTLAASSSSRTSRKSILRPSRSTRL